MQTTITPKKKYTLYAAFAVILSFFHSFACFSSDCFFMSSHGKDMLANGLTRWTDIFSVHGFDFMYQKWAMCISTYWIYSKFGMAGITAASIILYFVCLMILIAALEYLNPDKYMFNVFTIITAALSLSPVSAFRPHMVAMALLTLFLVLMEEFTKEPKRIHYLYFLLISVAIMWAHSTMWMLILIFVLPYVCDFELIKRMLPGCEEDNTTDKKNLLKVIATICFGSLLQPNGLHQYEYMRVCSTAISGDYQLYIGELRPQLTSLSNLCIYALFALGVAIILMTKKYRLRAAYMMCGGLILSLISYRFAPYSTAIVLFGVAMNRQALEIDLPKKFTKSVIAGLIFLSIVWSGCVVKFTSEEESYRLWLEYVGIPAVDHITAKDTRPPDEMTICALTPDAGSYIISKGYKTYFDCRAEVYDIKLNHKKDVLHEFAALCYGSYKGNDSITYMKDFDDDYNFDYYVVNKSEADAVKSLSHCANLLYKDHWMRVYSFDKTEF